MGVKIKFYASLFFCLILFNEIALIKLLYIYFGNDSPDSLIILVFARVNLLEYISSSISPYLFIIIISLGAHSNKFQVHYYSLFIGLLLCTCFHVINTIYQWFPIVNGSKMQSTFAVGSLLSIVYANVISLVSYLFSRFVVFKRLGA